MIFLARAPQPQPTSPPPYPSLELFRRRAGARAHRDRGGGFPDRHPHHPHRGHRGAPVGGEGRCVGGPEGGVVVLGSLGWGCVVLCLVVLGAGKPRAAARDLAAVDSLVGAAVCFGVVFVILFGE